MTKKKIEEKFYCLMKWLLFSSILGLFVIATRKSSLTLIYKQLYQTNNHNSLFTTTASDCSDIGLQEDQCQFVKSNCGGFNAIYLELYYCSNLWKPISISILVSCLLLLFGAISVVASDFFCPNLQTISSKLQLSESMAGVTILAFGNGSPDLFSTFSAMDSNAGSLAIGELIGAAFFIVAIVSGCMGIIKPFQSQKVTFMRDASFLTGAIMIITWIVYHQNIFWYHSIILILYYFSYVSVVVLGAYTDKSQKDSDTKQKVEQTIIDESTPLLYQRDGKPPRLSIPFKLSDQQQQQGSKSDYNVQNHLGHVIRPTSPNSTRNNSLYFDSIPRSHSTNNSIASKTYRRPMTPRVGFRTSLFGAIEFQNQVNNIRRANSSLSILPINKRYRQNSMPPPKWQMSPEMSQQHSPINHSNQQTYTYQPDENNTSAERTVGLLGRQRAFTMTDRLPIVSQRVAIPEAQDYFTYLSAQQQQKHSIHIQSSSPPTPAVVIRQLQTPEITIPEIRLAPPTNNIEEEEDDDDDRIPLPNNNSSRSRGNSTHSLAPPHSIFSGNEFFSARQSLELSASNSFDDQHQLLSIIMNVPHQQQKQQETNHSQLHLPIETHPHHHYRHHSEYSFSSSKHFNTTWHDIFDEIAQVMLPTLQGWKEKSLFSKLSALAAAPLVLIFTLTLPVAEIEQIKVDDVEVMDECIDCEEEEEVVTVTNSSNTMNSNLGVHDYLPIPTVVSEHDLSGKVIVDELDIRQGWNKHLLMIQSIVSTVFIFGVFALNEAIPLTMMILGVILGVMLFLFVMKSTRSDEPPTWFWALSFVGFFVALNWIFLLANEVVGLLQALGEIFSISEAIMGLTVFALGNSIGDFVANTAIAKMGFPTMAISACYAGPLLNMVLGVGVTSLYQNWKSGHEYKLDIAPTIIVSSIGLLTVLLSTLVVVCLNGYHVTKNLGWWMISVYFICCGINFMLEFQIIAF